MSQDEIPPSNEGTVAVEGISALTIQDPESSVANDRPELPHRSHDPENNMKRSDPFQFGSRYLSEKDNVFEFNAWDHVETDDTYKEYAELQYAKQREAPVSEFDKSRFNSDPAKWWNNFYKNNTANFFKDRKWLQQEFPILSQVTEPTYGLVQFWKLAQAQKAVEVIRANEAYDTKNIQADVWDAAGDDLPLDWKRVVQWNRAVQNVFKILKPGGDVLFRDYGRGDLAQVRFKKGRYLEENFYIRGDGTRVYFFEKDELVNIWTGKLPESDAQATDSTTEQECGFDIIDLGVDRRLLVNRAKELKMYRCWMQGRFKKKSLPSTNPK
ncbi:methyltransferase [Botrytis cinerea]